MSGRAWRPWRGLGLGLTFACLGLMACGEPDGDAGAGDEARTGAAAVPERAPPLATVDLSGDSVRLAGLMGDVVLLNVWATWCVPCRREIPELQALHEEYGEQGVRVVGVTVDSRSAEADVNGFVEEFGMTYPVWWDADQAFLTELGAVGVPVTVLIDRRGFITWSHLGVVDRHDPALRDAVRSALASPAT